MLYVGNKTGAEFEEQLEKQTEERIKPLLVAPNEARAAKNWAQFDRIRDELAVMGIVLKDNKDGTTSGA